MLTRRICCNTFSDRQNYAIKAANEEDGSVKVDIIGRAWQVQLEVRFPTGRNKVSVEKRILTLIHGTASVRFDHLGRHHLTSLPSPPLPAHIPPVT